jgi:DNA-binding NarL/FixJ family response regulator
MHGGGLHERTHSPHGDLLVSKEMMNLHHSPGARQRILEQISTGKSRKRIADELFIDLETVKSHIKNIYSQAGCTLPKLRR